MRNTQVNVLVALVVCVVFVPVASARTGDRTPIEKQPSAIELLAKYAATQDKLKSFIVKAEITERLRGRGSGRMYPKGLTKKVFHKTVEVRTDGRRCKVIRQRWGYINKRDPNVPRENATYTSVLWDGKTWYKFAKSTRPGQPGKVSISRTKDPKGLRSLLREEWAPNGYDANPESLEKTLREAHNISVRDKTDVVGKSECYVIDAVTKRGKYTVWIDLAHGYNIAKLVQTLKQGDLLNRWPVKAGTNTFSTKVLQFKRIDRVWVPWEAEQESEQKAPGWHLRTNLHYKRTKFTLNPDHDAPGYDALDSFLPGDIEDQTIVQIEGVKGKYRWFRGAKFVIDEKGRVVRNDPNKPRLPIVKTLPWPKDLNLESYPQPKEDGLILLCFCDISQQSSKGLLQELKEQSKNFELKGVGVVLVGKSDDVNVWVKKNGLDFKAGHIDSRLDGWIERWGVRELPWLVLAKGRIVTAAGFKLQELDEKIREAVDENR